MVNETFLRVLDLILTLSPPQSLLFQERYASLLLVPCTRISLTTYQGRVHLGEGRLLLRSINIPDIPAV